MNQRFQNEEIRLVAEQYADNELYKAVCTIGNQLESELTEFGLCPEECFIETLELLSGIADKGKEILSEVDDRWIRKSNEYRRFDRRVSDNEIRKAVGIIFGFAILAIDSSRDRFYRRTLSERLTQVIANHQFDGWASTLERIFSVPLPDGWFDAFIDEEPQEGDELALPKELDTRKARQCFARAIKKKYMKKADNGKYRWIGTNDKGNRSELAYFCGKVYGYVHTITGNAGESFPEESLNNLFGVTRLYSSLTQVYNAQKAQSWRRLIDEICE
jgi:hypothetical protein